MRKLAFAVVLVFVAALTLSAAGEMKGKTHEQTATFVSFDAAAKTMTMKDEKGESHTAPVSGKALEEAKSLKAGDKVMLTCQDNEKGEHQAVVGIKPVK